MTCITTKVLKTKSSTGADYNLSIDRTAVYFNGTRIGTVYGSTYENRPPFFNIYLGTKTTISSLVVQDYEIVQYSNLNDAINGVKYFWENPTEC